MSAAIKLDPIEVDLVTENSVDYIAIPKDMKPVHVERLVDRRMIAWVSGWTQEKETDYRFDLYPLNTARRSTLSFKVNADDISQDFYSGLGPPTKEGRKLANGEWHTRKFVGADQENSEQTSYPRLQNSSLDAAITQIEAQGVLRSLALEFEHFSKSSDPVAFRGETEPQQTTPRLLALAGLLEKVLALGDEFEKLPQDPVASA